MLPPCVCEKSSCRPIARAVMMVSFLNLALLALIMVVFLAVTSEARTLLDYDSCYNGGGWHPLVFKVMLDFPRIVA